MQDSNLFIRSGANKLRPERLPRKSTQDRENKLDAKMTESQQQLQKSEKKQIKKSIKKSNT